MTSNKEISPGATVRLNQIVYSQESALSAVVKAGRGSIPDDDLRLFVAPGGKDVEVIDLKVAAEDGVYITAASLPIQLLSDIAPVRQLDGKLTLAPNEIFLVFLVVRQKTKEDPNSIKSSLIAAAFGLMEDTKFGNAPVEIHPEIAMTEDEKKIPSGGKRIGTLASKTGPPVQIPVDELIIYPRDVNQLNEFLKETDGKILMDNRIVDYANETATSFLVRVNTVKADIKHLPQIRALFGEKEKLLASSEEVLRIYSMAMEYWIKGFITGVNPRLQFMGTPLTVDGTQAQPFNAMSADLTANIRIFADTPANLLKIRQAWAFVALWDKDIASIPVAFTRLSKLFEGYISVQLT
jgi:hypothetical protein